MKGCTVKHFAFCYNNRYPVYKEAKYGASYWPQKPESKQLKRIEKADRIQELNKNPTFTFSLKSAKRLIMQKYNRIISNTRNKLTSKKYWKELDQKDLKGIKDSFSQ